MKKWFERLKNKNILATYFAIFLTGILCIVISYIIKNNALGAESSSVHDLTFSMLNSIGVNFLVTALVIFITIPLLIGEEKSSLLRTKWALSSIFEERKDIDFRNPRRYYDVIGFGLKYLVGKPTNKRAKAFKSHIEKLLNEKECKLVIRIVTMDPNSPLLIECEKVAGKSFRADILKLIDWTQGLISQLPESNKNKLQLRFYNSFPLVSYCRIDSRLYIQPFSLGKKDIIYEYIYGGDGAENYDGYFEDVWKECENYCNPSLFEGIKRKEKIEKLLEYFCDYLTHPDNPKDFLHSIVAVFDFKDSTRSTHYSYNKALKNDDNLEKKRRNITQGVVGVMCEKACPVFHLFSNQTSYYQLTNIVDTEVMVEEKRAGAKEGMVAVLAIPVWNKEESQIIAALTFDFRYIPKHILDTDALNKELDGDNKLRLNNLFNIGRTCSSILRHWYVDYETSQLYICYDETI